MKIPCILLMVVSVLFTSCKDRDKSQDEDVTKTEKSLGELPEMSIYHLPGLWTDQDSNIYQLKELRGKVLVMVMIYTSCKAACPRLIADMQRIEDQVPDEYGNEIQYIFVSIDPETDTPSRMKTFAEANQMAGEQWLFLRSDVETTREFASVLAVNYKQISPIDFSHSNIISVFDRNGEMVFQQEGLDVAHTQTVRTIRDLADQM